MGLFQDGVTACPVGGGGGGIDGGGEEGGGAWPEGGSVGACCFMDGACWEFTEIECFDEGGEYVGDDTLCSQGLCDPAGACCLCGYCWNLTDDTCALLHGEFKGAGTTCEPNPCDEPLDGGAFSGDAEPTPYLSIQAVPDQIGIAIDEQEAVALARVRLRSDGLREALIAAGVMTIRRAHPGFSRADTLGTDRNGNPVRLLDLSPFFILNFSTSEEAMQATESLMECEEIVYASPHYVGTTRTHTPDPYYENFCGIPDAQWHLDNDGVRTASHCGQAEEGWDIGVEPAWGYYGYGDPSIGIIICDTGIVGGSPGYPSHDDLRVIELTDEQARLVQAHYPGFDLCNSHGTKMAGLAGALTYNGQGVAGVCGDCSLLDLEQALCDPGEECGDMGDETCDGLTGFGPTRALTALTFPLEETLCVFNLSGGSSGCPAAATIAPYYNLMKSGVACASAVADEFTVPHETGFPACCPFVVGVGGSTWEGYFWEENTDCHTGVHGSGTKASEYPYARLWGSVIDVCAPASGSVATTHWEELEGCPGTGPYAFTGGYNSGASAQVSGLMGLIQSVARETSGELLRADDVMGIVRSTARPFIESPEHHDGGTYPRICPECPREFYGTGIIDASYATTVAERVALGGYNLITATPTWETWGYELVNCEQTPGPGGVLYLQYKATVDVDLPPPLGDDPVFRNDRPWPAWVRFSDNTTTYVALGTDDLADAWNVARYDTGITGARMSVPNDQYQTTITGYNFAKVRYRGEFIEVTILRPEDELSIEYASPTFFSSVDTEAETHGPRVEIDPIWPSPASTEVLLSFSVVEPIEVRFEVHDVSGRLVKMFQAKQYHPGAHVLRWDTRELDGRRAAAGAYWVSARVGGKVHSQKVLVIR